MVSSSSSVKNEEEHIRGLYLSLPYVSGRLRSEAVKHQGEERVDDRLDELLESLVVAWDTVDKWDEFALELCLFTSNPHQEKIARSIFDLSRSVPNLIPFLSRLVALLSESMNRLWTVLFDLLEGEFQIQLTSKVGKEHLMLMRHVRFVGFLCNFGIAEPEMVSKRMEKLLEWKHKIRFEVADKLLSTCNSFYSITPEVVDSIKKLRVKLDESRASFHYAQLLEEEGREAKAKADAQKGKAKKALAREKELEALVREKAALESDENERKSHEVKKLTKSKRKYAKKMRRMEKKAAEGVDARVAAVAAWEANGNESADALAPREAKLKESEEALAREKMALAVEQVKEDTFAVLQLRELGLDKDMKAFNFMQVQLEDLRGNAACTE